MNFATAELIREKYCQGAMQMDLSNEYLTHPTTISDIIQGKRYLVPDGKPLKLGQSIWNVLLSQPKLGCSL